MSGDVEAIRRKLVIVGDGACGKTSLLFAFAKGTFPEVYVPPTFENHFVDVDVVDDNDTKTVVELALWDTARHEEYSDRLRALSYPDAHVFLLCFSIDSPDSLDNVQEKWHPEISHHAPPTIPLLLIGCKKDLRSNPPTIESLRKVSQQPVTPEHGETLAPKIGAKHYLECSARTGEGVHAVFKHAARFALLHTNKRASSKCIIV